jgi:uncharacterized protein YvpB
VFVNLLPIDGIKIAHAIVVTGFDRNAVNVCDPLRGDRVLPRSPFDAAWAMMHNLVILILDVQVFPDKLGWLRC